MNTKKWIITSIAVAVVFTVLDMVIHGGIFGETYKATAAIWRPEAEMMSLMPFGWATTLVISFLLVLIYDKGYSGQGSRLNEGLRFGLIMGLFTALPMSVWTYIMIPMPLGLAIGWFVTAFVEMLIIGSIIGLVYKK